MKRYTLLRSSSRQQSRLRRQSSVHRDEGGLGEDCHQVLFFEVGTGDVELADLFGDHRLLALDLEVKLDVGLHVGLDCLRAGALAGCLEVSDELLAILYSDEAEDERVAEVDDALALLLELRSVRWQVREVQGRCLLL